MPLALEIMERSGSRSLELKGTEKIENSKYDLTPRRKGAKNIGQIV